MLYWILFISRVSMVLQARKIDRTGPDAPAVSTSQVGSCFGFEDLSQLSFTGSEKERSVYRRPWTDRTLAWRLSIWKTTNYEHQSPSTFVCFSLALICPRSLFPGASNGPKCRKRSMPISGLSGLCPGGQGGQREGPGLHRSSSSVHFSLRRFVADARGPTMVP